MDLSALSYMEQLFIYFDKLYYITSCIYAHIYLYIYRIYALYYIIIEIILIKQSVKHLINIYVDTYIISNDIIIVTRT